MITGFYDIFEQKLDKMKARLKAELDKPKKERNKTFIKKELKDIRKLQKKIAELKQTLGKTCPHCGEKL